jgi:crotonobetainyl-CoA:carnitine CoA-transferase CaiB-like acyl-CoA transferase
MTAQEALDAFQAVGVPCSRINYLSEVVTDPHVIARESLLTQHHPTAGEVRIVGAPWRFASESDSRRGATPAPLRGQHSREILLKLGLDAPRIDELAEEGVVWAP